MSQENTSVKDAAEQSAATIVREIRGLIRATPPSFTKQRKLLQAKLRLLTSARPPLDMKKFTEELHKGQIAFRTSGLAVRRLEKIHAHAKHLIRSRLPRAFDGKVIDTRKDTRGQLYFEAANGQALSASRMTGVRLANYSARRVTSGRVNHALRRRIVAPLGNPVLVDIVKRELALNATRA